MKPLSSSSDAANAAHHHHTGQLQKSVSNPNMGPNLPPKKLPPTPVSSSPPSTAPIKAHAPTAPPPAVPASAQHHAPVVTTPPVPHKQPPKPPRGQPLPPVPAAKTANTILSHAAHPPPPIHPLPPQPAHHTHPPASNSTPSSKQNGAHVNTNLPGMPANHATGWSPNLCIGEITNLLQDLQQAVVPGANSLGPRIVNIVLSLTVSGILIFIPC